MPQHFRQIGRAALFISMVMMIGLFILGIARGDEISLSALIIGLLWLVWVGWMAFRSDLFNRTE